MGVLKNFGEGVFAGDVIQKQSLPQDSRGRSCRFQCRVRLRRALSKLPLCSKQYQETFDLRAEIWTRHFNGTDGYRARTLESHVKRKR